MISTCDKSIWKEKKFKDVIEMKPDYVIIMLGTNDAKKDNWLEQNFLHSYSEMIKMM